MRAYDSSFVRASPADDDDEDDEEDDAKRREKEGASAGRILPCCEPTPPVEPRKADTPIRKSEWASIVRSSGNSRVEGD